MNRIFTLFFAAALSLTACAQFPYNTSTGQFSTAMSPSPRDFAWSWPSYADQQINVTFAATGMTTVIFRMASPNGGDAYLTVYGGTVISNLGNGYTRYTAIISRTNVPPARSYRGEFMAANQDGTNYTPTAILARGDITVQWSAFNATNQLVYTNTAVIYVSPLEITNIYIVGSAGTGAVTAVNNRQIGITFPSPSSATNGLNTASLIESTSNHVILATNHLTVIVKTNYSGGSGSITNNRVGAGSSSRLSITNGSGPEAVYSFDASGLATGTPLYVQSETNASARLASNVWAAADSTTNYVQRTGDTMTGNLLATNTGASQAFIGTYHSNAYVVMQFTGNGINPMLSMRRGSTNIWLAAVASNFVRTASGGLSPAYTIWDSGLDGSGSGLDADLLDGLDSLQFLRTIATNGTGNVVTNLTFGGNVVTQQMGTISGGGGGGGSVEPEILGFSRWEGSASGWHVDSFAPSIDDVSTTTATNLDLYQHFIYSTSITTITNTIAGRFTVPVTNHFPFKFRANQAGAVIVVSMFDGAAAKIVTQTLASASTTCTTNAPIAGGAATNFSLEFRWASTNAANAHRVGVGR